MDQLYVFRLASSQVDRVPVDNYIHSRALCPCSRRAQHHHVPDFIFAWFASARASHAKPDSVTSRKGHASRLISSLPNLNLQSTSVHINIIKPSSVPSHRNNRNVPLKSSAQIQLNAQHNTVPSINTRLNKDRTPPEKAQHQPTNQPNLNPTQKHHPPPTPQNGPPNPPTKTRKYSLQQTKREEHGPPAISTQEERWPEVAHWDRHVE